MSSRELPHSTSELNSMGCGADSAALPSWFRALVLVAATVIFCSCRTREAALSDPFHERERRLAEAAPDSVRVAAPPAVVPAAEDTAAVEPVVAPGANPVVLASAELPPDARPQALAATTSAPYVEATPELAGAYSHVPVAPLADCGPTGAGPQYKLPPSDEVLCDGGDSGLPLAVVQDGSVTGLEIEDTAAHYRTQEGQIVIQSTNEVCIYAPRFGSVRQVTGASINVNRRGPEGLATDVASVGAEGQLATRAALQNEEPQASLLQQPTSLLRGRQQQGGLENDQGISRATGRQSPAATLQALRFVLVDNREQPLTVGGMLNAIHWTHDLGVQVAIGRQTAQVVAADRQAAILYRVEESPEPRLAIVKLADRAAAHPGDVVHFALKYENVGNRPISELTIIDNLTTRLAYVEGSQQSDRPAEFFTEMNEGGSLILRWQLPAPLQPGESGLIQFDCRVR